MNLYNCCAKFFGMIDKLITSNADGLNSISIKVRSLT